jgi:hypothetical protein
MKSAFCAPGLGQHSWGIQFCHITPNKALQDDAYAWVQHVSELHIMYVFCEECVYIHTYIHMWWPESLLYLRGENSSFFLFGLSQVPIGHSWPWGKAKTHREERGDNYYFWFSWSHRWTCKWSSRVRIWLSIVMFYLQLVVEISLQIL